MKSFVTLLMAFALLAGPAKGVQTLSFEDCVSEVISSNPELLAAHSAVYSSRHLLQASYGNFFPKLSGQMLIEYGQASELGTSTAAPTGTGNAWFFTPQFQIKQNLFNGLLDNAKVKVARANLEAAEADLATTKAKISNDLKVAYAGLLYAQNLQHLRADILARTEANYKLVSLRFDGGNENLGSKRLSFANFKQAQFGATQAKHTILRASVLLAKVLGRKRADDLRVAADIPMGALEAQPDFEKLATEIPSYRKAEAQERAALGQKQQSRASFLPVVDFTSSLSAPSDFNQISTLSISSLSFSLPIFNGGTDYHNYKSAAQNAITAAMTKRKVQTEGATALSDAYFLFAEAIEQVEVSRSFLSALETQEKIAKAQYNTGLLTFQDWDRIETDYINRQTAVLAAEQSRVTAEAAWENAKGTGVIP